MAFNQDASGGTQPQPGKAGLTSGKKWLIGCGGCLVFLLVIAAMLVGLCVWGFQIAAQSSQQTTQALLGKSFQSEQYHSFAWPLQTGQLKTAGMLIHHNGEPIILIGQLSLNTEEWLMLQQLLKTNSKDLKQLTQSLSQLSTQTGNRLQANGFDVQDVHQTLLSNHKSYFTIYATLKQGDKSKTTFSPIVLALLPQKENTLMVFLGESPSKASNVEIPAQFKLTQRFLDDEIKALVEVSELDNQLINN